MRIRLPFAGAFSLLLLIAGYVGLSSLQPNVYVNDKVLHVFTFFLLTVVFYWIIDTNRRRILNLTLVVCTLCLGVGSEFLQGFLPNGRNFDLYDIIANVVGSLAGLGLCSWYHLRMLDRRRLRKQYGALAGGESETDVELGEGVSLGGGHEEGTVEVGSASETREGVSKMTEEDVDNWNERGDEDWDADTTNSR